MNNQQITDIIKRVHGFFLFIYRGDKYAKIRVFDDTIRDIVYTDWPGIYARIDEYRKFGCVDISFSYWHSHVSNNGDPIFYFNHPVNKETNMQEYFKEHFYHEPIDYLGLPQ